MATNIEWKARTRNPEQQHDLARQLAGGAPQLLEQVDTFFQVPHRRLKLRRWLYLAGQARIHLDDESSACSLANRPDQVDVFRDYPDTVHAAV